MSNMKEILDSNINLLKEEFRLKMDEADKFMLEQFEITALNIENTKLEIEEKSLKREAKVKEEIMTSFE